MAHPLGYHGPRLAVRARPDHDPEMAGLHAHERDGRVGGGAGDGADRRRPRHVVGLAVEREHRAANVGEGDGAPGEHEAPREHAVVHDELLDELAEGGARPGHEAFTAEEATPGFASHEGAAIVELGQELEPLLDLFPRAQDLEAGAGDHARQAFDAFDRLGDDRLDDAHEEGRRVLVEGGQILVDVDGGTEGHDRRDPLAAEIGRRLVGEHAALRVATEVHLAPAHAAHGLDAADDGEDVIVERALHAALLALGRPEVDDVRLHAARSQRDHGRVLRLEVVDLARNHQRRDQERHGGVLRFGRRVPAQSVVRTLIDDVERRAIGLPQPTDASELERIGRAHAGPCDGLLPKAPAVRWHRRRTPRFRDRAVPRSGAGTSAAPRSLPSKRARRRASSSAAA